MDEEWNFVIQTKTQVKYQGAKKMKILRESFPKLFFLTSDYENFVIVEGHFRMTAYALVPESFNDVEVIVGKCDRAELNLWM